MIANGCCMIPVSHLRYKHSIFPLIFFSLWFSVALSLSLIFPMTCDSFNLSLKLSVAMVSTAVYSLLLILILFSLYFHHCLSQVSWNGDVVYVIVY